MPGDEHGNKSEGDREYETENKAAKAGELDPLRWLPESIVPPSDAQRAGRADGARDRAAESGNIFEFDIFGGLSNDSEKSSRGSTLSDRGGGSSGGGGDYVGSGGASGSYSYLSSGNAHLGRARNGSGGLIIGLIFVVLYVYVSHLWYFGSGDWSSALRGSFWGYFLNAIISLITLVGAGISAILQTIF